MRLVIILLAVGLLSISWEAEIKTGIFGLTGFVETTIKHFKHSLCDEGDACYKDITPAEDNSSVWSPNDEKTISDIPIWSPADDNSSVGSPHDKKATPNIPVERPSVETLESQDVPNAPFSDSPTLPPSFGLPDEPPTLPPKLDTNPPDISNCEFEGGWPELHDKIIKGTSRCD